MKKLICFTLLFILVCSTYAQNQVKEESIRLFFNELKAASDGAKQLWNQDLYGPTLLIDPSTRKIYANESDNMGTLAPKDNIYIGILPQDVNFSNTALDWNGKRWAMIMLPLPENRDDRINLLAHESFHRIQPDLGFALHNADNKHLDEMEGRISLRLEMESLKKALRSSDQDEIRKHLTNALIFRKYRYKQFAEGAVNENLLEMNEGIAEYTGIIVTSRQDEQTKSYLINGMERLLKNRTFVRSFAYQTIPSYGYILYKKDHEWNKQINANTDLTAFFIKKFELKIPAPTQQIFKKLATAYNGKIIFEEETTRDIENKRVVKAYKEKFVESPHFEIKFESMNYSFDPRTIIPIGQYGTYYPTTRITDNWGILTVEKGGLISADWGKISLSIPISIDKNLIKGDGWMLELHDQYTVEADEQKRNYYLKKNVQK